MQSVEFGAANEPAAQSVHKIEFAVDEKEPAAQTEQLAPLSSEPAGHVHARTAPEPVTEKPVAHEHDAGELAAEPAFDDA